MTSQRALIIELSSAKLSAEQGLKALKADYKNTVKTMKRSIIQTEESLTKEYQSRTNQLIAEIDKLVRIVTFSLF
jgi:hypothetical protein